MKSIVSEKSIINYIRKIYSNIIDKDLSDDEIISIYWFDNNMKNTIFPWVLKIERELKTIFVNLYNKKYKSFKDVLLNSNKYNCSFSLIKPIVNKVKKFSSIEEFVFSITFGEFIKILYYFDISIKKEIDKLLKIKKISENFYECILITRNTIAHNLSLLSMCDVSVLDSINTIKKYLAFNDHEKELILTNDIDAIFRKLSKEIRFDLF